MLVPFLGGTVKIANTELSSAVVRSMIALMRQGSILNSPGNGNASGRPLDIAWLQRTYKTFRAGVWIRDHVENASMSSPHLS